MTHERIGTARHDRVTGGARDRPGPDRPERGARREMEGEPGTGEREADARRHGVESEPSARLSLEQRGASQEHDEPPDPDAAPRHGPAPDDGSQPLAGGALAANEEEGVGC